MKNNNAAAKASRTGSRHALTYRGVSYDTGGNYRTGQGWLSREVWNEERMRADIRAIRQDLRCNSVTIEGSVLSRLVSTSTAALEQGLRVQLQPILVDHPQHEILQYLEATALHAESARRQGGHIDLSVGSGHVLFTPGIVPGDNYRERMSTYFGDEADEREVSDELNTFLKKANETARSVFGGKLLYAADSYEVVDWSLFDYVGLNYYYSYHPNRSGYVEELRQFQKWRKPILICEFGAATYANAAAAAGEAYDIVDRSLDIPEVRPGYVRSEAEQARQVRMLLNVFEEVGIYGVMAAPFIHPTHPHSAEPKFDLDMASMAIVKTVRDDYFRSDSPYRWEPKEAFRVVAEHYRGHEAR